MTKTTTVYLVCFSSHEEIFTATLEEAVHLVENSSSEYYELWEMTTCPYDLEEYMVAGLNHTELPPTRLKETLLYSNAYPVFQDQKPLHGDLRQ